MARLRAWDLGLTAVLRQLLVGRAGKFRKILESRGLGFRA